MLKSLAGLSVFALALAPTLAAAQDSSDPIVIPTHSWSSQIVISNVVGQIYEEMGNYVEYVTADGQAVYESIRLGDVTLNAEVWEGTHATSLTAALERGVSSRAGRARGDHTRGLVVSDVGSRTTAPACPKWEALNECAEILCDARDGGTRVVIWGPVDWEKHEPRTHRRRRLDSRSQRRFCRGPVGKHRRSRSQPGSDRVFKLDSEFRGVLFWPGEFGGQVSAYEEGCRNRPRQWGQSRCHVLIVATPAGCWLKKAPGTAWKEKWPAHSASIEENVV